MVYFKIQERQFDISKKEYEILKKNNLIDPKKFKNNISKIQKLYDTALFEVNKPFKKKNFTKLEQLKAFAVQGFILYKQYEYDEGLKQLQFGENLISELESKERTEGLFWIKLLYFTKAKINHGKGLLDVALDYYQKTQEISNQMGNSFDIDNVLISIGDVYKDRGNLDLALIHYQKYLVINENTDNIQTIAISLQKIGEVYQHKGKYDFAYDYYQRSIDLFNNINFKLGIAQSHIFIGQIYLFRGLIKQALSCFQISLEISYNIGKLDVIAISIRNIGICDMYQNKSDSALERITTSYKILNEIGNAIETSSSLYWLILISLEIEYKDQESNYKNELQLLNERMDIKLINLRYLLIKGVNLRMGKRFKLLIKAQYIFQKITHEEIIDFEYTVFAMLNFCELLIFEFENSNDKEILNIIVNLFDKLSIIAEEQDSHLLSIEILILKSKLSLVNLDINQSISLLDTAYEIAVKYGLNKLATKVDLNKINLSNKIKKWLLIANQSKFGTKGFGEAKFIDYLKEIAKFFKSNNIDNFH